MLNRILPRREPKAESYWISKLDTLCVQLTVVAVLLIPTAQVLVILPIWRNASLWIEGITAVIACAATALVAFFHWYYYKWERWTHIHTMLAFGVALWVVMTYAHIKTEIQVFAILQILVFGFVLNTAASLSLPLPHSK